MNLIDLTTRANNGEKDAIEMLYLEYAHERDEKQTFSDELVEFYKDNENKPYSMYYYGKMLIEGLGIPNDLNKGIKYLEESRKLGCSESNVMLATLAYYDLYDKDTYENLIQKACDDNNVNGFYLKGFFEKENNVDEFLKYMKITADMGNSNGYHQIGQYHHDNGDYSKAKKYYKKAIKQENEHSYLNLASMYRLGEGCKEDIDKAIELLKKSEKLGNIKAAVCLGSIYSDSDPAKAKKYYKKAIKKDDPLACYNIGLVYQDEGNKKKSIHHFLKGARLGHFQSIMKLTKLGIDPATEDDDLDEVIEQKDRFHQMFKHFGAYDGEWY